MGDRVFFCYAREDQGFAVPLARELKNRGVGVWLDQWDIPAEADWDKTIDQALGGCDRLLIVLSPASVKSGEVRGELREALDLGKPILPVLYRPCEIPRQLRLIQFVDFSGREADHPDALDKLVRACRGEADVTAPEGRKQHRVAWLRSSGIRSKVLMAAVGILLAAIAWYALGTKAEERRRMNSAALSPDGAYLAAATGQGSGVGIARIWDVNSGREIHRFTTKEGPFWVVAWSPKGNSLAVGDHEGKIRTYEAGTWKLAHELDGPRSFIKFIAWSPDGRALATGDDTGTVWAWDAASGKCLFHKSPHSKNIGAAAWSPDGARLATASWDNSIAIVDGRSGDLLKRLNGHASYVNAVAWSPDGKWIASGSLGNPYLIVWNASGQPRMLEGHGSSVERVAWSRDGNYLASASKDNSVQVWDGRAFNTVGRFNLQGSFNSGESLTWSKEGNRLAAGDEANVWILTPQGDVGQKFAGYSKDPYSGIEIGGWSLDGKRLAGFRTDDGAKVWDIATGNLVGSFRVNFFDAITD
jgi:WD40 repeat protein